MLYNVHFIRSRSISSECAVRFTILLPFAVFLDQALERGEADGWWWCESASVAKVGHCDAQLVPAM